MVGETSRLQREDMDEDMKSRLGLSMVDERLYTVGHRLHVDIASHHIRLLGREFSRPELPFQILSYLQ